MKRFIFAYLVAITTIFFHGCGGGSGSSESSDNSRTKRTLDNQSKKFFGYLADANVKIYLLQNGKKKLLFSEKTSSGNTLDKIGNFNRHIDAMHPGNYYQIEITGGQSWDADGDGVKDTQPTPSHDTWRTIYKGHQRHIGWWSIPQLKTVSNLEQKISVH